MIVGFGSNLSHPTIGNSIQIIKESIDQLKKSGLALDVLSSFYVTEPQGMADGTPDFVNAVAMTVSNQPPWELFRIMRYVEKTIGMNQPHRDTQGRPISRFIDIDFLDCYGQEYHEFREYELCLPHPRMHERLFVMIPLWEIFPQWQHPRFDLDKAKLISQYSHQKVIRSDLQ